MIVFYFNLHLKKHDSSGKRLKSEKLEWGRNQAIYSLKVKS